MACRTEEEIRRLFCVEASDYWRTHHIPGIAGDDRPKRLGTFKANIIGINLVGTIVVMVIVVLTFLLGEDYLADIALIYVVLSFIAVMMLCRIYINLYQRNQRKKEEASHDR